MALSQPSADHRRMGLYSHLTTEQLTTLATACTQRLTERAQQREKQLAKPDTCAPQTAPGLPSGKVMMRVK